MTWSPSLCLQGGGRNALRRQQCRNDAGDRLEHGERPGSGASRNRSRKSFIPRAALRAYNIAMQIEKRRELTVFIFLTFVLAPILAVIIVAGYGFAVWMYQLIAGPPSV